MRMGRAAPATRIIGGGLVAGPGGPLGGVAKNKTDTSNVYSGCPCKDCVFTRQGRPLGRLTPVRQAASICRGPPHGALFTILLCAPKVADQPVISVSAPAAEEGALRRFADRRSFAINRKWPIKTPSNPPSNLPWSRSLLQTVTLSRRHGRTLSTRQPGDCSTKRDYGSLVRVTFRFFG